MLNRRVFMMRADASETASAVVVGASAAAQPQDLHGRALTDLRISVTDRCNFRCSYCMPKAKFGKGYAFMPTSQMLDFGEISRVALVFVAAGVRTIRLTGGEPLLRKNIEELVGMLSELAAFDGQHLDLAMTTNGSLLARKADLLRRAGLTRLTVSLDALDDSTFRRMNDVDFGVADVLDGIDAALAAGFPSVKVNMVVKRGVNDQEVVPLAQYFREHYRGAVELRFIEYMDVGNSNGWRKEHVVPSDTLVELLHKRYPLERIGLEKPSATASQWRYKDGLGKVGTVSSVSEPFCGECTRARLSTDGRLFTCLFATGGHDLRTILRGVGRGAEPALVDQHLSEAVRGIWRTREDNYSQKRQSQGTRGISERIEMHYIGG